ncbi:MAG: trehalose-6-phosphate synthase [Candidatus Glassbacteria bacterium]
MVFEKMVGGMPGKSLKSSGKRLVIISNRLPIVVEKTDEGYSVRPGSGGLVTALAPVLRNRGGLWIGWPGTSEEVDLSDSIPEASKEIGYSLKLVKLTEEEINGFYHGFSNEIIWPLFHDLQSRCNFDPNYWTSYKEVNSKFAEKIVESTSGEDYIWVHDYHLMSVAREMRKMGINYALGFFLHIPFPSLDIFLKLPWRFEILRDLLEYDIIGFQTLRDRSNFLQCVRTLIKEASFHGKGRVITVNTAEKSVRVGNFPISIDYEEFVKTASTQEVADKAWFLHEDLPQRTLILGVDRLDYTKGIPYRLEAFRNALRRFPDLHRNTSLIQIVVPSRADIPTYHDLKTEIERLVGEINGEFTQSGWIPIHYIFRHLDPIELIAYYRTCEIALLTPLKDGMNLVAKEYCASSLEENCVLILSEFAGAVAQLQRGALIVNPYDVEGIASAIYRAYTMDYDERRWRMRKLRQSIRRQDIFWWIDSFLRAAFAKDLDDFPFLEEYIPEAD